MPAHNRRADWNRKKDFPMRIRLETLDETALCEARAEQEALLTESGVAGERVQNNNFDGCVSI